MGVRGSVAVVYNMGVGLCTVNIKYCGKLLTRGIVCGMLEFRGADVVPWGWDTMTNKRSLGFHSERGDSPGYGKDTGA